MKVVLRQRQVLQAGSTGWCCCLSISGWVNRDGKLVKVRPEHTAGAAPCMSSVLSLHGRPPQSVLSHRPCRPSRIHRHQRLAGLAPGDLLPQEAPDKRLSGLHPRPVTMVTEALVFLGARESSPRGSGKGPRETPEQGPSRWTWAVEWGWGGSERHPKAKNRVILEGMWLALGS